MKLKDDFFTIEKETIGENGVEYQIQLKALHPVYEAHFPNNPVTPGVYMVQMVTELLSEYLGRKLYLKKADKIKFQNTINPLKDNIVNIQLHVKEEEGNIYKTTANIYNESNVFAQLSLILAAAD